MGGLAAGALCDFQCQARHLAPAPHSHPSISFLILINVSFLLMCIHVSSCLHKDLRGLQKLRESQTAQEMQVKLGPAHNLLSLQTEERLLEPRCPAEGPSLGCWRGARHIPWLCSEAPCPTAQAHLAKESCVSTTSLSVV